MKKEEIKKLLDQFEAAANIVEGHRNVGDAKGAETFVGLCKME